jgi:transposase-like protein
MAIGRITLAPPERCELERRARSRRLEAEDCKRAKLILLVAKGYSFSEICRRLDCTDRYISIWKRRFEHGRLSGLDSRYRGSQRRVAHGADGSQNPGSNTQRADGWNHPLE